MQTDNPDPAPGDAEAAKSEAMRRRAEMYRECFRRSQAIAAQRARSAAAGGVPSESEAARMVADFLARGGRVTVCPPAAEETGGDTAGGGQGERGKAG